MNAMSLEPELLSVIAALCLVTIVLSCVTVVLLRRQARMLEEKRRSDSCYRTVVDQAGDGIFMVDAETGRLIEGNFSFRRRLGYGADEIVGLKVEDILVETPVGPDTAAFACLTNTRSHPREIKQRCKNGQLLNVEVTVSQLEIAGRQTLCYIAHDVTERKQIELELLRNQQRLDHLAHHDSLTGLPNRLLLRTYLEQALQARSVDGGVALMLLDIDNFKMINDSCGHNAGDELLVEVARQLKMFVGPRGLVARLGGDEFVIVFRQVAGRDAATSDAEAILTMLTTPLRIAGRVIDTSVSIGVALCPQGSHDLDWLLHSADVAMYKAKAAGRNNVQFFQPEMNTQVRRQLTTRRERRATEDL
jgi:diguanylate cyclase (GGDEF)-like protein/PAS domain S-box-containing protein